MSEHLPVILIEVVLVFGGVLAFGWWQLRSVRRDREAAAARRLRQFSEQQAEQQEEPPQRPSVGKPEADTPHGDERRP